MRKLKAPEFDSNTQMDAVDLFCGMGGLSEGLRLAGFDIMGGVDSSKYAVPNYQLNFPESAVYFGDVRDLLREDWRNQEGSFSIQGLDLLAGGPPCQGVSQIGPRDLDDSRNLLFGVFLDVAERYKPVAILLESVPNINKLADGQINNRIMERLSRIGYSNAVRMNLEAEDYQLPQKRERTFYFATNDEYPNSYEIKDFVQSVADALKLEKEVSVWNSIGDLPAEVVESGEVVSYPSYDSPSTYQEEMRLDYEGSIYSQEMKLQRGISNRDFGLYNHHTKDMTDTRRERVKHLAPGDNGKVIPDNIWDGRPWKYRRLPLDSPSHTLLAQMRRDLSEWIHPKQDRWITVREAMRLQSFHDGFVLGVSEWRQLQQIGNSVPPLLGRVAGIISRALIADAKGRDSIAVVPEPIQSRLSV